MPFTTIDGANDPVPVLAQISPSRFEVRAPFRYHHPILLPAGVVVPDELEPAPSDLASVPRILLWLVPRYGTHTLAALVHDVLVAKPPGGDRNRADTIFRDALGELGVPWIRRWIMWAAVSLATVWSGSLTSKVRVSLWMAMVLVSGAAFWEATVTRIFRLDGWSWSVFGASTWWLACALVVAGLLFTPRVGLGWLAGAAIWFVMVPSVFVAVWVAGYLVVEWAARGGLWIVGRSKPVVNNRAIVSLSDVRSDPES